MEVVYEWARGMVINFRWWLWMHHHHHLFWKCPFLPRYSRVRRLPIWSPSTHPWTPLIQGVNQAPPCHHPQTLSKSSYSLPYIPPLPLPPFFIKQIYSLFVHMGWLCGVVLWGFLREPEIKQRWARLVHGWVTVHDRSRFVTQWGVLMQPKNHYRMTPGVRHSGIVNWLIYLFHLFYICMVLPSFLSLSRFKALFFFPSHSPKSRTWPTSRKGSSSVVSSDWKKSSGTFTRRRRSSAIRSWARKWKKRHTWSREISFLPPVCTPNDLEQLILVFPLSWWTLVYPGPTSCGGPCNHDMPSTICDRYRTFHNSVV